MGQETSACAQVSRPCNGAAPLRKPSIQSTDGSTDGVSRAGSKESVTPSSRGSRRGSKELFRGRKGSKEDTGGSFVRAPSGSPGRLARSIRSELGSPRRNNAAALTARLAGAMLLEDRQEDLMKVFKMLEKDRSGSVSCKELAAFLVADQALRVKYFRASTEEADVLRSIYRIIGCEMESLTWTEFRSAAKTYNFADKVAAALMTQEGQVRWKGLFEQLDANADGKITPEEFRNGLYGDTGACLLMILLGDTPEEAVARTPAEIEGAFRRLDKDGNGVLDYDELVSESAGFKLHESLADAMSTQKGKAAIKKAYKALDLNEDGKVSRNEWSTVLYRNDELMEKLVGDASSMKEEDIQKAFDRIDTDKNGSLSWQEFSFAFLSKAEVEEEMAERRRQRDSRRASSRSPSPGATGRRSVSQSTLPAVDTQEQRRSSRGPSVVRHSQRKSSRGPSAIIRVGAPIE